MLHKFKKSMLGAVITSSTILTGCATATLLDKDSGIRTHNVQSTLVDDAVGAFGKLFRL